MPGGKTACVESASSSITETTSLESQIRPSRGGARFDHARQLLVGVRHLEYSCSIIRPVLQYQYRAMPPYIQGCARAPVGGTAPIAGRIPPMLKVVNCRACQCLKGACRPGDYPAFLPNPGNRAHTCLPPLTLRIEGTAPPRAPFQLIAAPTERKKKGVGRKVRSARRGTVSRTRGAATFLGSRVARGGLVLLAVPPADLPGEHGAGPVVRPGSVHHFPCPSRTYIDVSVPVRLSPGGPLAATQAPAAQLSDRLGPVTPEENLGPKFL